MNAASKRIGACGSAAASCARHLECARLKLQIHVEVEIETGQDENGEHDWRSTCS